jgi:two-component system, OmpR family, heavy metal sensor histidine kinase CusS
MTTIRRQLTRNLLIAFAAPVVIGGAIAFALIRDELIEQFDAALDAQVLAVAAGTRVQPDGSINVEGSARIMRDFESSDAREHIDDQAPAMFEIRRADGTPIARSASLGDHNLMVPATDGAPSRIWNLVLPSGYAGRAASLRFHPDGSAAESAPLTIVVAVDRRDLDDTVRMIGLWLGGCGVLLLVVTFIAVPRLIRRAFAPIEALGAEAGRINADSLGTRFPTRDLPGELAPIAERLNDLLGRLQTSFDRERRFSADLAHELRTPVAELRALAELSMKWPDSRPADADRDVLAIAVQMEGIVTRLLTMLRSEHAQLPIATEPVDAVAVAQDVWRHLHARAETRALGVRWDVPTQLPIATDPILLRSILANLLQNAVEYTPTGGWVGIQARPCAGGIEISVRNDAGSLSTEDVPKLFDRFWRREASRSGGDHVGLGLSLARAFARAIGGDLTANLDAQGSLSFTLLVP